MPEVEDVIDDALDPNEPAGDETDPDTGEPAGDETDPDAGEPAGDEIDPDAGEPVPARRESRVQRLANENRELRERAARAEARAEERERLNRTNVDPREAEAREAEKLALMDPQERKDYFRDKEINVMKQSMQMTQIQMRDALDKTSYLTEAAANPTAKKLEADVEKMFQDSLRNGTFIPRLTLYKYKLGELAYEQSKKPVSKQVQKAKTAAVERTAASKGSPVSARTDTGGGKRKGGEETLEEMRQRILAREARGDTY